MELASLVGSWRLRRRLIDRRAGIRGRVEGELRIEPDADGLRWLEVGRLDWAGQTIDVRRGYALRRLGDEWWMTFEDGRPFHPWTPGRPVVHDCAEDVYTGLVEVEPTRLRTLWDVTGPTKSQRIVTRLDRSG
jgi:hypothetical protein